MTTFPIAHDALWNDAQDTNPDFHIHAVGHVTQQGQAYMTITTSTNSWALGFTGATAMLAIDANENVVWTSHLHVRGVDAKSVYWAQHAAVQTYYDEYLPADALATVTSIQFLMARDPHDRWFEDWAKVGAGIGAAAKAITEVLANVKSVLVGAKVT